MGRHKPRSHVFRPILVQMMTDAKSGFSTLKNFENQNFQFSTNFLMDFRLLLKSIYDVSGDPEYSVRELKHYLRSLKRFASKSGRGGPIQVIRMAK